MSPPTIRGITIQTVTIYVPVTATNVDEVTDISIKPVTTETGMVTVAIMRRNITTGKDTTGRAAIDITPIAAIDITGVVPIEDVNLADNNNEIFL